MKTLLFLFICCSLLCTQNTGLAVSYEAVRLNDGQPIITQAMFTVLGANLDGENINGPSVISVPNWISPDQRTDPEAQYYLYFAHHKGNYIRMAWATNITGPWYLYNVGNGSGTTVGRGVLDLDLGTSADAIEIGNNLTIYDHIASPDVFVDDANQRIVMYFHGPAAHSGIGKGQKSFAATSANGLNFNMPSDGGQTGHGIQPVMLGDFYFKVFAYSGDLYALSNYGWPYLALDADNPWTPPIGFDFSQELWIGWPDNPFQADINTDPHPDLYSLRHSAVSVVGDTLEVFHTRIGDAPERILFNTIDLSVGGMNGWDPTYPPAEILRPELAWEGVNEPIEPSASGSAPENVHQLRDPCLFVDSGGEFYLFYAGCGEDAIGLARLNVVVDPIYELSVQAQPSHIAYNSYSTVTATLVDVARNRAPVPYMTIQFASTASSRQGYLDSTYADTDLSGNATTTFYSRKRAADISVTATGPHGTIATTTITISRTGGEDPPPDPDVGSIHGRVYDTNGKGVRKATLELWEGGSLVRSTKSNGKGNYNFEEVPYGWYTVAALANGAFGTTDVWISASSPSVTSPEGDVVIE